MKRQDSVSFFRSSRVLWLSVFVIILGGLFEREAAAQPVSFGPKTDFGTGGEPFSVAMGDFNGDGKLDLVVANSISGDNTISILLGAGTGSFGGKTDFGTGNTPVAVAVADFNGDGSSIWRSRILTPPVSRFSWARAQAVLG